MDCLGANFLASLGLKSEDREAALSYLEQLDPDVMVIVHCLESASSLWEQIPLAAGEVGRKKRGAERNPGLRERRKP